MSKHKTDLKVVTTKTMQKKILSKMSGKILGILK